MVQGARRVQYHEDGSRSVRFANREYVERMVERNNRQILERNYIYRDTVLNRRIEVRRDFDDRPCRFWPEPLWFYQTPLGADAIDYSFFGPTYSSPYDPIWGWDYWSTYLWPAYGWWNYYSGWYWRPWGDRHHGYYRPSYAVADFVIASMLETAWEARIEAAEVAVQQQYEDQIIEAENEAQAAQLQAQEAQAEADAATAATEQAQAEAEQAQATAAPDSTVSDEDESQIADQVEQTSAQRENQTPVSSAFEDALNNDRYLFLVSSDVEESFDAGNGQSCKLLVGDILRKDTLIPGSGLVTMRVKVSQPGGCKAGTLVTLTVPQLQEIYDDFQETMDIGVQQLADRNKVTR